MSPEVIGATVGLAWGCGAALVVRAWTRRRVTLVERLEPMLAPRSANSGLLSDDVPLGTPLARRITAILAVVTSNPETVLARLARAGRTHGLSGHRARQVVWALSGLGLSLLAIIAIGFADGVSPRAAVVLLGCGALGGLGLCESTLSRAAKSRSARITSQFPAAADLLALAVGAGEPPVAAIERVAGTCGGDLGSELKITLADIRSGMTLLRALDGLAARTDLPVVGRFSRGVATALERGTPLSQVLRDQACDARQTAHQALVEAGGKREVTMLVPVVFLILPVTVLFAIFPLASSLRQ